MRINLLLIKTKLHYSAIADLHTLHITIAHAVFSVNCVFTGSCLITAPTMAIPLLPWSSTLWMAAPVQLTNSESELLYDWRFTANQFVLVTSPLRPTSSVFFQVNTYGHSPYVISSLTRGWVYLLQLLLVPASAVILMSESRGTHDHILLSQIRDSPSLEGQVPRVANCTPRHWVSFLSPPTTRRSTMEVFDPASTRAAQLTSKHVSVITSWLRRTENKFFYCCSNRFHGNVFCSWRRYTVTVLVHLLISRSLPSNGSTRYNATLCTAISSFPRAVFVTSVIGLTFLLPWLGSHGDYSPIATAAPSLGPLVPSSSLIRCQSLQVYHHHLSFHIMTYNRIQTIEILLSVGAAKTT
jgi:hypothetical protein